MLTRILIPVDFSNRSLQAARYAAAIASRFGATMELLHVVEPANFAYAMIEPSAELFHKAAEAGRKRVEQQLDALADSVSTDQLLIRSLLDGDPSDQILCAARRTKADLIVMPTQGRSRLRQFLIGSVTAKVLHDSAVPVWTGVHLHQKSNFPEFRLTKVLCAIDLGSQTHAVLRYAGRLAREFGAALTVMHVTGSAAGVQVRIEELLSQLGMQADIRIEAGDPRRVVAATAGVMHADVVVIGRACSTGMMGRLREQAYGIVRDSPCPVVSV